MSYFSNSNKNTMDIVAFTDGSCVNNGYENSTAGYAIAWPNEQFQSKGYKFKQDGVVPTNNMVEYMAAIVAIESVIHIDPDYTRHMYIYTDSQLLIDTVTKWMGTWKERGWKKRKNNRGEIKNLDLVKRLYDLTQDRTVYWGHIKAHTGMTDYFSTWNDIADKLAQAANK